MAEMTDVTKVVKDAAYIAVGVGVLGFQQAQIRRIELAKRIAGPREQLKGQLLGARSEISKKVSQIDGQFGEVLNRVEESLSPMDKYIPVQARGAVKVTQARVRQVSSFLRERTRSAA
jgi:hypothetical protein